MKYFFQTHDGVFYPDDEGTELNSISDARIEAVKVLADFLSEKPAELWHDDMLELTVQDQQRLTLFSIQVSVVLAPALGQTNRENDR